MATERKFNLHSYLAGKLRSASRKWPPLNEAKKAAKVPVRVEFDEKLMVLRAYDESGKLLVTVPVCKKGQSRDRVMYRCAQCKRLFFDYEYLKTKAGKVKKTAMIALDHIMPVVDPHRGFESWDVYIDRLFNGAIQVLCNYPGLRDGVQSCHHIKTAMEKAIQAERLRQEKGTAPAKKRKTK
jgi:hypothetical protein